MSSSHTDISPQATNPTKPNQTFKQETYREALTRLVAGGGVRDLGGVSGACGDCEGDGDQGDNGRPGAYPVALRVAAIAGGGAPRLSHWSSGYCYRESAGRRRRKKRIETIARVLNERIKYIESQRRQGVRRIELPRVETFDRKKRETSGEAITVLVYSGSDAAVPKNNIKLPLLHVQSSLHIIYIHLKYHL